jgi:hypothetical protein
VKLTRFYIVSGILCLCCSFIRTDTKPLTIHAKYDYFTADNIGNVYTIKEEELVKYLPTGKFFTRYSNLRLGKITSVDATNPLKLVLYYRDFQQIVFLDDQLSLNSEVVSLEKLGYEQTDLVCASANNSFWIYNKQNNELIRFNEASKKIAFTGNLKQILQSNLNPNLMLEHNGYLYLNCPETGVYVFDIFGAFSKIISIKNLTQFQVNENILYYQKDSSFCSYDHHLFEEACKTLPYNIEPNSIKYRDQKLYTGFKDSIVVQKF